MGDFSLFSSPGDQERNVTTKLDVITCRQENKTKQNKILSFSIRTAVFSLDGLSRSTGHSWLSLPEQEEPQGRAALPPLPNATFIKSAQAAMAHKTFTLQSKFTGDFILGYSATMHLESEKTNNSYLPCRETS